MPITKIWPNAALARQVARLSECAGGVAGVAAEHLETGRTFEQNGDKPFSMASTFKIAVAGAILRQIDDGRRTLGDMITVQDSARVDSEIIVSHLPHPGVSLSIYNLIEVMLTLSDNTASDVLTEVAGGPAAVTAWLRSIGIADQRVDRDTAALTRDFFGIGPGPVLEHLRAAIAKNPDLDKKGDLPNPPFDDDPRDTSTPNAMTQLLRTLYLGDALTQHSKATLFDVLARCRTGEARLRGLLPLKTPVAHKTGTIGGTCNDVGLITLPDGTHATVAVFIMKSDKPPVDRERTIAEIARTMFDAFLLSG